MVVEATVVEEARVVVVMAAVVATRVVDVGMDPYTIRIQHMLGAQ
jgi:hypothetical protein